MWKETSAWIALRTFSVSWESDRYIKMVYQHRTDMLMNGIFLHPLLVGYLVHINFSVVVELTTTSKDGFACFYFFSSPLRHTVRTNMYYRSLTHSVTLYFSNKFLFFPLILFVRLFLDVCPSHHAICYVFTAFCNDWKSPYENHIETKGVTLVRECP